MAKKPITQVLKLAELKKLANKQKLSKAQLASYFVLDNEGETLGKAVLALNVKKVDVGKAAPTPDEVGKIHATAMGEPAVAAAAKLAPKAAKKKIAVPKSKLRVVVEGDSWFRLPFWYPKDVVDYLDDDFDVNPLAIWGDTLRNIHAQKQYLQVLGAGLRRHLLLSGGGNDVLGSIDKYVSKRDVGDTNAATASKYVRPQFETIVKKLLGYYRGIITDVRTRIDGPVVIYLHGYANAIARPGGKYLGGPLENLDFDPVQHAPMCAAIVSHMVKQFNDGLVSLASSNAGVVYVDLRGAFAGADDWHSDEIHPSAKGARKAASLLKQSINTNVAMA